MIKNLINKLFGIENLYIKWGLISFLVLAFIGIFLMGDYKSPGIKEDNQHRERIGQNPTDKVPNIVKDKDNTANTNQRLEREIKNSDQSNQKNAPVINGIVISNLKSIENEMHSSYVMGTIRNPNNKDYRNVEVNIEIYDEGTHQLLGIAHDTIAVLKHGTSLDFHALVMVNGKPYQYKLKNVTGYNQN